MKIWGSNKKQRTTILVFLTIFYIFGFTWEFANHNRNIKDNSVYLFIGITLILSALFYIYLLFDNARSFEINCTIKSSKYYLDKITGKYNMQYGDILCRTHIANELKDYLNSTNNKGYNFNIIDKTDNMLVDSNRCSYEIWADNQFRSMYCILSDNMTILI